MRWEIPAGAMHKYTDLTDTEPRYQGGFIWDYIEPVYFEKDRYGQEFQAYGGDCGERPTDYNFSGNGICYGGERDASPKMQEVKFNYQNISVAFEEHSFTVVNKNLFADTSEYQCIVILQKNGTVVKKQKMDTNVAPLSSGSYEIPFVIPEDAEYAVTVSFVLREDTFWAKAGHEVAFGQKVYKKEVKFAVPEKPLQVVRGKVNIGVKGDDFDCLFSLLNGGLVSYRYAGKEMIEKSRCQTSGERRWTMTTAAWRRDATHSGRSPACTSVTEMAACSTMCRQPWKRQNTA